MDQLRDEIKRLRLEEMRADSAQSLEVVLDVDQLNPLSEVLERYFGPALKRPGESPSREAKKYADPYGGIHPNQTLYHRKDSAVSSLAMIWPWGDGVMMTLKIYRVRA